MQHRFCPGAYQAARPDEKRQGAFDLEVDERLLVPPERFLDTVFWGRADPKAVLLLGKALEVNRRYDAQRKAADVSTNPYAVIMAGITVRHAEPGDYGALHQVFTQPKAVWGTMQLPYPSVESWRKKLESPPPDFYSLVACADGEVVGHLGLQALTRPRRRHVGTLGMAVRDDLQGKGVGSALMRAALGLADGWLQLKRIELTVYTDNAPAIRLYEKFGFGLEGTHAQYAFRDGVFVDAYSMARLRPEP